MASNDLLNQLAKKPPAQKVGLLFGALAVLGVFYYQFWYSGTIEDRDGFQYRKNTLINEQGKLDKDLADKKRLAEQNEELQRTIRDNQKALPTEAELPSFFDHLQRKAGDAGVSIRRWVRRAEQDVDIYIKVPVEVEVIGTFYGIMRYFSLLGSSSIITSGGSSDAGDSRVDERIVSVEDLYLGGTKLKDGEIVLTAKFTASTFRRQEAAAPRGAKKKRAAKKKKTGTAGQVADKVNKAGKTRVNNVDKKAAAAGGK